jgi:peptide/nickel transport system substrate-binding protein
LVFAYRLDPTTLDPLFLGGRQYEDITELLYSTLLHEDANGAFTPEVAAVVPTKSNGGISGDGLDVRFRLRRDVRWSDGTALTAADVAFTLTEILNPANNIVTTQTYGEIKSAVATSRYTLTVHLRKRYAPILEGVNVAILPKHILWRAPSLNNLPFDSHPIGSGPYELKRWIRNDVIELVANPYYSGMRPGVHEIDLRSIPNDNTALSMLRAGTIDGSFGMDLSLLPEVRTLSKYSVLEGSASYMKALTFNMHDPILQDRIVRRAVATAIDLPAIVSRATRGAFDARDAAFPAFRWSYDPSARYSQYNVRLANDMLDAAGWHRNADGGRYRAGTRLDIEIAYMSGQPSNEEIAIQLQEQLALVGIDVTLHGFSAFQFFGKEDPTTNKHSQAVFWSILEPPDPDQSTFLDCNGPQNMMSYCNKSVDAANLAALDTYDRSKRVVLYRIVQHLLARDLPFIPVFAGRDFDALTKRLHVLNRGAQIDTFQDVAAWRTR